LPPRPYPGLRPFEPREDAIFFGREPMIDEIIDLLAQRCLLLVHGSSGAGKSSVVLAGVLPRLSRQQLGGDLALELGKRQQHVQGQSAHRGGGVELLGNGDKRDIVLVEELNQLGEIRQRAGQAIDLVDHARSNQTSW
jgi:hypothetical protein